MITQQYSYEIDQQASKISQQQLHSNIYDSGGSGGDGGTTKPSQISHSDDLSLISNCIDELAKKSTNNIKSISGNDIRGENSFNVGNDGSGSAGDIIDGLLDSEFQPPPGAPKSENTARLRSYRLNIE